MAHWTKNTEHAGAKNGGGFYGTRNEAKASSKVGRRQNDQAAIAEGLSEVAASEREAVDLAHDAAIIASASITVEDLPVGDLFTVQEQEMWERPRPVKMTSSPASAVAAFNAALTTRDDFCDEIAVVVHRSDENGDYSFVGRLTREHIGSRLVGVAS
jgi:hypothetical protein